MSIADLFTGIGPIPPEVREAFKGTEFWCECGGLVFPQTIDAGVCFSCKATLQLSECEYSEEE